MITINKTDEKKLSEKVIFGSSWMFGAKLLKHSSSLVVMMILANLLMPEDFGLIAIGTIAISLIRIFTEVGFKESIIKEVDAVTPNMLNTAWLVELTRGSLIFLFVYLFSPLIASFFNEPNAVSVIQVLALTSLIHGTTSIRLILLQKELNFRRQFIYEVIGIGAQLLVTLPLAFLLQNVWALVIGAITNELLKVFASYYLMPYFPSMQFDKSAFKKMFVFGKWYFLGVIVSYFAMEIDTFFVAKLFDSNLLGIYVFAFTISNKPVVELSKTVSKVLFPTYAKLSRDPQRIRSAFKKSTTVLYSIVAPLCVGLSLVSNDLVKVFLDSSWLEMINVLEILALAALARCIAVPSGSIFYGIDKPKISFYISLARIITLVTSLIIIVHLTNSLIYATYAVLLANITVSCVFFVFLFYETSIDLSDCLKIFTPIVISVSVMTLSVLLVQSLVSTEIYSLIASIISGALAYVFMIILLWKFFNIGAGNEFIIFKNVLTKQR